MTNSTQRSNTVSSPSSQNAKKNNRRSISDIVASFEAMKQKHGTGASPQGSPRNAQQHQRRVSDTSRIQDKIAWAQSQFSKKDEQQNQNNNQQSRSRTRSIGSRFRKDTGSPLSASVPSSSSPSPLGSALAQDNNSNTSSPSSHPHHGRSQSSMIRVSNSDTSSQSSTADDVSAGSPTLTADYLAKLRDGDSPTSYSRQAHRRSKSSLSSGGYSFSLSNDEVSTEDPSEYYLEDLNIICAHEEDWLHFEDEDTEHNIVLAEDNHIKATTLDKLVQKITIPSATEFDSTVLDAVLLTYRGFTTGTEFIDTLKRRFNTPPPSDKREPGDAFHTWKKKWLVPMRFRICQTLKTWMERHFYDFRHDKELSQHLSNFIEEISKTKSTEKIGNVLRATYKRNARKKDTLSPKDIGEYTRRGGTSKDDLPQPKYPSKGITALFGGSSDSSEYPILDWPSIEIARQLTLIQYDLLTKILPRECLNQSWNQKNREKKAPNIFAMIQWTNKIGLWVADRILAEESSSKRGSIMKKFIDIANELRKLNNFDGVFGIMGGLNCNAVHRLKLTWEHVQGKHLKTFEELEELMDSNFSYRAMRQAMTKGGVPCIPYIGVYLTDLTFIEDANPDRLANGLVNFGKSRLLCEIIREIQKYQTAPYALLDVPELRKKLLSLEPDDSETLYKLSLKREPRKKKRTHTVAH